MTSFRNLWVVTRIGAVLLVFSLALAARAWLLWGDEVDAERNYAGETVGEPDHTPSLTVGAAAGVLFLAGVVVVSVSEARRPLVRQPDPTP